MAAFADSRRAANLAAGVDPERAEAGIGHQVGLAMRVSPHRARRCVNWARLLTGQLPGLFAALQAGRTSEYRSVLVARHAAWLGAADRAVLDAQLAPRLGSLGDKRTEQAARQIASRLDAEGYVELARRAGSGRRVTVRPVPDAMARLTALLPAPQAMACYAALGRAADLAPGSGEPRSRGQVMADVLVERLTGQATADAVPVEVQLVMPVGTLLAPEPAPTGAEPGYLAGYGPVPGPWARDLVLTGSAPRWIRRLYTAPGSGQLVAMDSRRRCFTGAQRRYVITRDQVCRTPWCEAPIRHIDHIIPAADGGPTSIGNAQGLCQACNLAKESPGWQARPGPGTTVTITTPTGHRYRSKPPDLTYYPRSPLEARLEILLDDHVA